MDAVGVDDGVELLAPEKYCWNVGGGG